MKKLIIAAVVAFVWFMVSDYLIHGVWLMPEYRRIPDSWRPMADMQHKMWIMWLGTLLFAVMFAYIYKRGAEKKPWVGQGVRYGILMVLFASIPTVLGEYVVFRVPHMLAVKWMCAYAVQLIVAGLLVAAIQKEPASAP